MAQQYFTEEITAVKFATMKRSLSLYAPAWLATALAAWFRLRGILHGPLKATYGAGDSDSATIVPRDDLPPRALSRWAPILEQLGDLRFSPLRFGIADTIGQKQQVHALFLDEPGSTIATLQWIRMRGASGPIEKTPVEFNSYANADPEIMTGCVTEKELALAGMLTVPFVDTLVLADHLPLSDIYRQHLERTAGRSCFRMDPDAALAKHKTRNERRFRWTLDQGLLRPLTAREINRLRQLRPH